MGLLSVNKGQNPFFILKKGVYEMKPITIWTRMNYETKQFEHNHIEDGHLMTTKPVGNKEQTANWKKGIWEKAHKYLNDNQVIQNS
jgi:hypothetical protein